MSRRAGVTGPLKWKTKPHLSGPKLATAKATQRSKEAGARETGSEMLAAEMTLSKCGSKKAERRTARSLP